MQLQIWISSLAMAVSAASGADHAQANAIIGAKHVCEERRGHHCSTACLHGTLLDRNLQ